MNRTSIIQTLINFKKAKTYLEIGVHQGDCFLHIKATKKIAVDPKILITKKKKHQYYEMNSDDFFEIKPKILSKKGLDIVFIDGLHTYEQSLKDVLNSLKYLNKKGTIVIHDCNPTSEAIAYPAKSIEQADSLNLPGWEGKWSGNVWKTIVHLRSVFDNLRIFVLDCDYGLGIIARGKPEEKLYFTLQEIDNFTYNDLNNNREKFLNLKPASFFYKFIEML